MTTIPRPYRPTCGWRAASRRVADLSLPLAAGGLLLLLAACATKVAPSSTPSAPAHPDFVYPAVPASLRADPAVGRLDRGWQLLQSNRLGDSDREFQAALRTSPGFYPALTGRGYVALAHRDYDRALTAFDAALERNPAYAPALVGRGEGLVARHREGEALVAFEAALRADPSLVELGRRIDVLRFRHVEGLIAAARSAAAAGRTADAREAYGRALAATPDSAFLYRELGQLDRQADRPDAALTNFRKAVELDASDSASLIDIGSLLEDRQDYQGAADAYRQAEAIDPGPDVAARLARVTTKAREARMPPELRAIPASSQITRGELAALVATRLEPLLRKAPERRVVMTDVRGSWAAAWITDVVSRGVMDPFENHTFQPRARVQRGDLADVVSRLVRLAAQDRPALRSALTARPAVADVSPAHLKYSAVAIAVASGVMPLADDRRFNVTRPVSGAEAVQVIDRLRTLLDR